MLEIGASKKDITCFIKGVGFFGYGMHFHKAEDIETPLYVRAFCFRDTESGKKIAYISAEILTCTIAVKKGVSDKLGKEHPHLGYSENNLMIAGTHTHSAPGGFSHYALYNFTIPGYAPKVYQTIVGGIVDAIVEADKNMRPGKLYFGTGDFDPSVDVAFNRSIKAYNHNKDIEVLNEKDTHLAVHRRMYQLRMDDLLGNPIGSINWFGVHTTSAGNDRFRICSDNKGYAAVFFEEYLKERSGASQTGSTEPAPIAVFAQDACGDVSPNYVWSRKRKKMRGKYVDDYESAKYNGNLQFEKAKEIFENSSANPVSTTGLDFILSFHNFSNIAVDKEFTDGKEIHRTGPPCMGVAFFEGSTDGKGMPKILGNIVRTWASIFRTYEKISAAFSNKEQREKVFSKYDTQGKKHIMMETSERKILGTALINDLIIPSWADKTIFYLKEQYKSGGLADKPWAPDILPVQLFVIGKIAIAGIPAEISTVAGIRLRKSILNVLKARGIEQVILSPYSNGYSGYITTYEEFQLQCYEGGHTMFGEWTFAAYQTKFKELALEMLKEPGKQKAGSHLRPVEFTEEDLKKRMFHE